MSNIQTFIHRVREVSAIELTRGNWPEIAAWSRRCGSTITPAPPVEDDRIAAWVPTATCSEFAREGWWIFRDPSGFVTLSPEEFAATYRPRVPEAQKRAEQVMVGELLLGRTVDTDLELFVPEHRAVADVVRDLRADGQRVDPVTVAAGLDRRGQLSEIGGVSYLMELTGVAGAATEREKRQR